MAEIPESARDAIKAELESRRADPEFRQRLKARIEADSEILRRLEEPEASPVVAELASPEKASDFIPGFIPAAESPEPEMPGQLAFDGTEP